MCHDEGTYTKTAALNLGAHIYTSEDFADDKISKHAQTPAATKSETSQPGSTQCSDLCQEAYGTAAGLGFTTPDDRHAVTLNKGAHMYVRDDPIEANDWTKQRAMPLISQH